MDLSDIIWYIVFAVVGIFSTAAQNKGKKKSQKIPQSQQDNHPEEKHNSPLPYEEYDESEYSDETDDNEYNENKEYTLEEIFRALREGNPLPPKEENYIPIEENDTPSHTGEESYTSPHHPIVSTVFAEGGNPITDIAGDEISDERQGSYTESLIDIDTVDWRQAVITGEILTRKY